MAKGNICYSGGAEGADTLFGEWADKMGHNVVHYHFRNNKAKLKNHKILSEFYLVQSDPYLQDANKYIRRKFPTRTVDVDNLLRRNYYQIADSNKIYAVTSLGERGIPLGGTAWAVVMGILNGITEAYVFDQSDNKWYKFRGYDKTKKTIRWEEMKKRPPMPQGAWTGIGSRTLSNMAELAIADLFCEECKVCSGSGFSGTGTGYGDVCSECGGQKELPRQ